MNDRMPKVRTRPARDYPVARGVAPPPHWPRQPAAVRPIPIAPPGLPAYASVDGWLRHSLLASGIVLLLVLSSAVGLQISQLAKSPVREAMHVAATPPASAPTRPIPAPKAVAAASAPAPKMATPPPAAVKDAPKRSDSATAKPAAPSPAIATTPAKPEPSKPEPARPAPTFVKDAQPIFQAKCTSCHGANNKKKGGLDLRTLDALFKGGESGAVVTRGQADKSLLIESIENGSMPPGKRQLTGTEKDTLRRWIEGGAK